MLFYLQNLKREKQQPNNGRLKDSLLLFKTFNKQRLKGLGPEKCFKFNAIREVRCTFMGSEVYGYGELCHLRCMDMGPEVYVYGA